VGSLKREKKGDEIEKHVQGGQASQRRFLLKPWTIVKKHKGKFGPRGGGMILEKEYMYWGQPGGSLKNIATEGLGGVQPFLQPLLNSWGRGLGGGGPGEGEQGFTGMGVRTYRAGVAMRREKNRTHKKLEPNASLGFVRANI